MQDFLQKVYSDEIFAPFLQDFLQNITPFLTVRNKTLIIVWGAGHSYPQFAYTRWTSHIYAVGSTPFAATNRPDLC